MIGPTKKKMPDKLICTYCEFLFTKTLGGTIRFPSKWIVNYCKHQNQITENSEISFIGRGIPYTPEWCPIIKNIDSGKFVLSELVNRGSYSDIKKKRQGY